MSLISMEINDFYKPSTKDQDTRLIKEFNGNKFFLILDGHGANSKKYVELVKFKFNERLEKIDLSLDVEEQLRQIFGSIDRECNINEFKMSGTTCSLVIITPEKMYVATVGDSDVYLFNKDNELHKLNIDHNGLSKKEMERLKKFPSTQIVYASNKMFGERLVWANGKFNEMDKNLHYNKNRMGEPAIYFKSKGSMLAVSRSIGDYHLKAAGIICTPEITVHELPKVGEQLLIASDGFWDCWSKEELIEELIDMEKRLNLHKTSLLLNKYYFGCETADDNSLIHIKF